MSNFYFGDDFVVDLQHIIAMEKYFNNFEEEPFLIQIGLNNDDKLFRRFKTKDQMEDCFKTIVKRLQEIQK